MTNTNDKDDDNEAETHVLTQLKYFRDRMDLLASYGLEMPDFLFLEGMFESTDRFPLFWLYRLGMQNPQALGINDSAELRTYILGVIIGYAGGLKNTWPDIRMDGDEGFSIEGVPI